MTPAAGSAFIPTPRPSCTPGTGAAAGWAAAWHALLAGLALALCLGGCARTALLLQPYVSAPGIFTHEQMRRAILLGGAEQGWIMEEASSSHIRGTLYIRNHLAQIDITYTAEGFAIDYADSVNLMYDGHVIHRRYNVWIMALRGAILGQLSQAPPDAG